MSKADYIVDVSETTFPSAVLARSDETPVIVDFWAPWCEPCRVLGPLLERLADEAKGAFVLAKLNVDDSPNLAAEYGIRGLPAVKAFRGGKVVAEFGGAQPEGKVRDFVRGVAPSAADRTLAEAASLLATRHWAQAEAAYRRVLADQPGSSAAALGLIKTLVAQGRGCETEELLEGFPGGDEIAVADKLKPLAVLLCEVEAADAPVDESDLDTLYHQSARLLARGQWEAGMDGLLDVLRQNKKYRRGEPRLAMLGLFELLGDDDPLTREYRGELASVLF